jgi:hypothetical protein
MNVITPVDNTNNIRIADFVRLTTPTETFRFATTASALTIAAVDAQPFEAVGQLVKIGDATKDMLGLVLGQNIKGSQIEMWHGFFNTDGALITTGGSGGLYQFFNGYVNNMSISEQWMEELRMFVGTVTVSASSIQLILQNRTAGRYTNNNSWTFFNPTDTSMDRVSFITTINYQFGKTA